MLVPVPVQCSGRSGCHQQQDHQPGDLVHVGEPPRSRPTHRLPCPDGILGGEQVSQPRYRPMFPTSHSTAMLSSTPTTPQLTSLRSRMSTRDTQETCDVSMTTSSSTRKRNKYVVANICYGEVCLELIKTKRGQDVLLEVMRVSAD